MINKKSSNLIINKNIPEIIYGFCMFLLCMPYFMWSAGKVNLFIFLIIGIISIRYSKKITIKDIILLILFSFIFIYASIGNNFSGLFFKLLLLTFIVIREKKILIGFQWFKKFFAISLGLSLIAYTLVVVFSIPLSYNLIKPLNSLKSGDYIQYPFLVSESLLGFRYYFIRFYGMFDEPGVIGSFATVILFIDNYNLKSRQNLIIFLGGLLSFSLFFIVSSIAFYLFTVSFKKRMLVIPVFLIFFLLTRDNLIISNLIWDRLTIENGEWKGDNRSSVSLDAFYADFLKSNDLLLGKGNMYLTQYGEVGSSTFKQLIINYGLLFMIILCLSYTFWAFTYIKKLKYVMLFLFLYFGMIYQRPFIFDPPYFFIFVIAIYQFKRIGIEKSADMNLSIGVNKVRTSRIDTKVL